MIAGRTERITRAFVMLALAVALPMVTMSPAGAQCYPPPCGGGGPGGPGATTTTVRPTTTTTVPGTTTTTRAVATTTTTTVAPVAAPPDKSVKAPEKPVAGQGLLSRTGANIVPLVAIALGLALVGLAMSRVARRRTAVAGPTDLSH